MKSLNKFKTSYKKAQEALTLRLFYLNLFDFFRDWDSTPQLCEINQAIIAEAKKDQKPFNLSKKQAKQFLVDHWLAYQKYCATNKIKIPPLSIYEAGTFFEKGNHASTGDSVLVSNNVLSNRLADLVKIDSKHVAFVSQFAYVPSSLSCAHISDDQENIEYRHHIIISWKSDLISPYLIAKEECDKLKEISIWYHWDIVAGIHNAYLSNKKNISRFEKWRVSQLSHQTKNIFSSDDQGQYLHKFSLDDLKYSLQRVWSYTEKKLTATDISNILINNHTATNSSLPSYD